jgi:hypothetical protein
MNHIVSAVRTLSMMDSSGDTSFGWDAAEDEWVIPMIRAKMEAGYTFWIVERNPLREVRLERADALGENRHVVIRDAAARELFEQGRIGLASIAEHGEARVLRRARTPGEAAAADTVAHRPLRGG